MLSFASLINQKTAWSPRSVVYLSDSQVALRSIRIYKLRKLQELIMEIGRRLSSQRDRYGPTSDKGLCPRSRRAWCNALTHLRSCARADRDRPGGFEGPYDKDVAFHEPFTTFAFIAAVTKKLDMITTVMILPQRQTVLVAKQAAELAILSNNRFKLGIGVGWNTVEYTGLNENFKNRGKRQEEQVELMRLLWESEVLEYKGDYHHIDKASINPRPL